MANYDELGYNSLDISPNPIFLTERAAETAVANGIVRIGAIGEEIRVIDSFLKDHVRRPEYQLPGDVDELSFVFRWGGEGNELKWKIPFTNQRGWDAMLHKAPLETRLLSGQDISQQQLDELRAGKVPAGSQTLAQLDLGKAVEITVETWESPHLTRQFISGVLYNRAQRRNRTVGGNIKRDLFEATDVQSIVRPALLDAIKFDLDTMAPFALLRREGLKD